MILGCHRVDSGPSFLCIVIKKQRIMTTGTTTNVIASLVKEMEEQAAITKTFMELVPTDKADWKPHEKSMKLVALASHVAELPGWVELTLTTEELDFETAPYTPNPINSPQDLLDLLQRNVENGKKALLEADEAALDENWTLRSGDIIHSVSTKGEVIRMAYNQVVHHRAQLGVYFRLLGIPVPPSFGPTADHPEF